MKELCIGKITTPELADWFHIKENTLSSKKKQYLKKLSTYCEFTPYKGGVEVHKIYSPVYTKNPNYQIIEKNFCKTWSSTGLDSCKRVSQEIYEKHKDELTIGESTAYCYTRDARNVLYGKPMVGKGKKGVCSYIWCKKDQYGYCVPLTEEEEKIKKQILQEYFGTIDEKVILVEKMVQDGELLEEEAYGYLRKISNLT